LSDGEAGRVTRRLDAVQQLCREVCCSIFGANLFTLLFRLSSQSAFGTQCPGLGRRPPASVQRRTRVPLGRRWTPPALVAAAGHQSRPAAQESCRIIVTLPPCFMDTGRCLFSAWAHEKVSNQAMPCNVFIYSMFPQLQCSDSASRCLGLRRRPPASVRRC